VLAWDIAAALPGLRREAEGRMVDACVIRRPGGPSVFDPVLGDYVDPDDEVVYEGRCEVQIADGLSTRETEVGGTEAALSRVTVKVPTSVVGIRRGDLVEITACRNDADLIGTEFRVLESPAKSWATARRLHVERMSAT